MTSIRSGHPRGKAVFLLLASFGILWGLNQAIRQQISRMDQAVSDISDLRDPSPFRVALSGHLDKIHLNTLAFLHNVDPAVPAQIEQSEKEFGSLLHEFEKQNPKLFPTKAGEDILLVFGGLESAVDETLKVSSNLETRKAALDQNFKQALFLIEGRLLPLIRKHHQGQEHQEAMLTIENQLRAWQQSLVPAWPQPTPAQQSITSEADNKGATLVDLYADQEDLLPAEKTTLRQFKTLWTSNGDLIRQGFAQGLVQAQTLDRINESYKDVKETLSKALPAMRPDEMEQKKKTILISMRLHLILAGLLDLVGLVVAIAAWIGAWRLWKNGPGTPKTVPTAAPSAQTPILEMNLKGLIISWSDAAERLYGYHSVEIISQPISLLFGSESEIGRLYSEMKSNPALRFETRHRDKKGTIFPIRIDFRPVTVDGHVKAVGLICHRM